MSKAIPISASSPVLLDVRVVEGPDDVAVIEAEGELDLSTVPDLRGPLFDRIEGGVQVVLDLSKVSFIDSSGIAVVLHAHRWASDAANGGEPTVGLVVAPSSQVARVFELSALDRALPIFANRDEAISRQSKTADAG